MDLAVDCVIFGFEADDLSVILIRRSNPYFKNAWALPGSMIYEHESLEDAAERTLYDLTGLKGLFLDQVMAFSDPDRVAGPRIVTVGFMAIIDKSRYNLELRVRDRIFWATPANMSVSTKWPGFVCQIFPLCPTITTKYALLP